LSFKISALRSPEELAWVIHTYGEEFFGKLVGTSYQGSFQLPKMEGLYISVPYRTYFGGYL